MRLERASTKAIKYSILSFHYSKSVPSVSLAYSVFNANNEFCGVICYGLGANNNLNIKYDLPKGTVIELVRVALNGKQECTSKAVALSLKLLKKNAPLVKLVVSYADTSQGHNGSIYQATNWIYEGVSKGATEILINGKATHTKTIHSVLGKNDWETVKKAYPSAKKVKAGDKHKYIYPLTKELKKKYSILHKQYPKKRV